MPTERSRTAPLRTRAEKKSARRDAILEAALDEFCERGFAATRIEDVARRAEVAKGTIYLNFTDKEALFQELIRSRLGHHVLRLENARPQPGQSMRETLEAALVPLLRQIRTTRMGDLLRLMIAESGRFPNLAEFYYREVLQRAMKAIERLAGHGLENGELAGDELIRFPQIVGAPVLLTLVWTTLFDRFAPLDEKALLSAYLDILFGRTPNAATASTRREGKNTRE
jgi:AcrR family transcriptional regulator